MTETSSDLQEFASRIKSAELRAVFKFWNICRGKDRFPTWARLETQLHALTSERIWAFDYHRNTGQFTARFARNVPIVGFGKSFHGTRLEDMHSHDVFEIARANLLRIVTEPACCRWSGRLFKAEDRIVEGERILMPIGWDELAPDGIFGASDFDFAVTETPEHLELFHDVAEWASLRTPEGHL